MQRDIAEKIADVPGVTSVAFSTALPLEAEFENDMVVTAFLVWGYVALASPAGRGVLVALAAWTKFAPLLAWPLWASNFVLVEGSAPFSSEQWTNSPATPTVSNNENVVTLPAYGPMKFFRLRQP